MIYTLSLHDALPICSRKVPSHRRNATVALRSSCRGDSGPAAWHRIRSSPDPERRPRPTYERDRKSTRLNSSHVSTSYAVFCLKKKIKEHTVYSSLI